MFSWAVGSLSASGATSIAIFCVTTNALCWLAGVVVELVFVAVSVGTSAVSLVGIVVAAIVWVGNTSGIVCGIMGCVVWGMV